LLAKVNPEPWGLASGRGPHVADELGMTDRVLSYPYGSIEGEPSFPLTNFMTPQAYLAGKDRGTRGTFGNSQTHCIQLPNAFLFARGANDLPAPTREDYVAFAERLLPGHGETIVAGWAAINDVDAAAIEVACAKVAALQGLNLETGDLQGLLFGDPKRFVSDLAQMLKVRATLEAFRTAALDGADKKIVGAKLAAYVGAASAWQATHDYKNNWYWPRMEEALMKVDAATYGPLFAERAYRGEGTTPFEQVQNAFKQVETFTPRLLKAIEKTAADLQR
jgi:hypothetical protein